VCNPAVIPLVIAAVGTAVKAIGGAKAGKRQAKSAIAAQKIEDRQIQAQAGAEAQARLTRARAERARLQAASAESGVAGISVDELLTNVDFASGSDVALINKNLQNRRDASFAGLESELNSISIPSVFGALALGIPQDAVSTGAVKFQDNGKPFLGNQPGKG